MPTVKDATFNLCAGLGSLPFLATTFNDPGQTRDLERSWSSLDDP